jgi:hypothetical protein
MESGDRCNVFIRVGFRSRRVQTLKFRLQKENEIKTIYLIKDGMNKRVVRSVPRTKQENYRQP